jgi:hypothetical protein
MTTHAEKFKEKTDEETGEQKSEETLADLEYA